MGKNYLLFYLMMKPPPPKKNECYVQPLDTIHKNERLHTNFKNLNYYILKIKL